MIKNGIKDIEYWLNDDKRQLIKINDKIIFYKRPEEKETIEVLVTNLKFYDDLLSMYKDTFDNHLKNIYNTPEEAVEDTFYYTEEEVKRYGCVAIYFNKL